MYKWHADQRRQAGRTRSISFAGLSHQPDPAFEHIHEPGGFRRNYVKLRANEQGTEEPQMLNNFIDFLLLFGHFVRRNHCYICHLGLPTFQAGENLDEDEEKLEDEEQLAGPSREVTDTTENTPLLRGTRGTFHSALSRSRSRSKQRKGSAGHGSATNTQAVLMAGPLVFVKRLFCYSTHVFSSLNRLLELAFCSWARRRCSVIVSFALC